MKTFNVEAEYHMYLEKIDAHRVKIKILNPELAMYINGMVVFTPNGDKHPDWTVYTPKAGNARIIEFAKSSTLWKEIQEACIDAVKLEESYKDTDKVDDMKRYDSMSQEEFEKVQQIIDPSHTTRPKDKTYNFLLRNLFLCGECGFAITVEQKQKLIKSTGETKTYIYYHCTGKNKNIKCTQPKRHVSEDELLKQIKDKLTKFTIDPDFYKLAIEALAHEEDEVVEKNSAKSLAHDRAIEKAQRSITNLRRMRYSGEADDDSWYFAEMQTLEDELERLQDARNKDEYKARNWREVADETFTFARYAKEDFDSNDLEKKRSVVMKLGEKLTILDRTIQFTPNKLFVPLEKMNESKAELSELVRTDNLQIKTPAFQHGSLSWLALADTLRTSSVDYDECRLKLIKEILDKSNISAYT